ncbi:MAG: hypothetical protein V5A66_03225 [Candidatus Thermoplasmatota archaeon]
MIEGKKFPKVKGESLSEKEVVLPDDVEGEIILVGVAFKRGAQEMLDSWTNYTKSGRMPPSLGGG